MALNLDEIKQMNFESTEIPALPVKPGDNAAYRLTPDDYAMMPDNKTDIYALRRELSVIFAERFKDYAQFKVMCDIKRDTFQKMLRFKGGRNITYDMLSKIVVGAGLSSGKAKELFALAGHPLTARCSLSRLQTACIWRRQSLNMRMP